MRRGRGRAKGLFDQYIPLCLKKSSMALKCGKQGSKVVENGKNVFMHEVTFQETMIYILITFLPSWFDCCLSNCRRVTLIPVFP